MSFLEKYRMLMSPEGLGNEPVGDTGGAPPPEPSDTGGSEVSDPPERRSIRDELEHQFAEGRETPTDTIEDKSKAGRFAPRAKKGKEAAPAAPDPAAPAPVAATEIPASLPKEAHEAWATTPPAIQQAFIKREADMVQGVRQLQQRYQDIDQALQPRINAIRQHGHTPGQAINQLFSWMDALAQNPRVAFPALLQSFGLRPEQIFGYAQQSQPDPNAVQPQPGEPEPVRQQTQLPPELFQALEVMAQKITGMESYTQQQNEARTAEVVQNWANDKPHFNHVRTLMAQMIASGAVPLKNGRVDLDSAYQMAIYAHPGVRQSVLSAEQAAQAKAMADKATAEKAAQQAAAEKARRTARGSITPSAPGANIGAGKAPVSKGKSVRESLVEAMKQVNEA